MGLVDAGPIFTPPARPEPPPRLATILSVTPYRVVGERSQGDGYAESDARNTSVLRPLTFQVIYRYESRLYNLVVPERLHEGLKRTLKTAVRADIEERRYRESPLDALQPLLPIEFEV